MREEAVNDGWAATNRLACALIHRGAVPARAGDDTGTHFYDAKLLAHARTYHLDLAPFAGFDAARRLREGGAFDLVLVTGDARRVTLVLDLQDPDLADAIAAAACRRAGLPAPTAAR
jgi:hypothetical protein